MIRFASEVAFVTERFDRVLASGEFVRVHAEDFCQALAVRPERKYQNIGGPGPREILGLLTDVSSVPQEDCATFFNAIAFNYLLGGTDAHAKNYSLLFGPGQVRLAPLYDIASAFPYYDRQRLKLAKKVGSHYNRDHATDRDWDTLGKAAGLSVAGSARVRELVRVSQRPQTFSKRLRPPTEFALLERHLRNSTRREAFASAVSSPVPRGTKRGLPSGSAPKYDANHCRFGTSPSLIPACDRPSP